MNKKIIGITVGALALIIIVVGGMSSMKKKGIDPTQGVKAIFQSSLKVDSAAKYLPQDSIMFYNLAGLNSIWSDIKGSNFWKEFSSLRLWQDLGVQANLEGLLAAMEEKLGMEVTESRFMDLLGESVTVSLVMSEGSKDVRVLLQTAVGKKTQFLEGMLKGLIEANEEESERKEYSGEAIFYFPPANPETDFEVRYVLVNNILTFGFGKAASDLEKIVDIIKNSSPALATTPNYVEARSKIKDGAFTEYYSDFSRVTNLADDLLQPLIDQRPEQFNNVNLDEIKKQLGQLKIVCGSAVRGSEGVEMTSYVIPDLTKMTPEEKKSWQKSGAGVQSYLFGPKDSLLVNTTGGIDASGLWDRMINSGGEENAQYVQDFVEGLREFEKTAGIDVKKDIVDKIGNEFSFIFEGVALDGLFPIPRLGFVLQSDYAGELRVKFHKALQGVLAGGALPFPITLNEEKSGDTQYTIFQTPLGEGVSPVLASNSKWLILGTNRVTLDRFFAAKGGSDNISSNSRYSSLFKSTQGKHSQQNYIDLMGVNDLVKNITQWVIQRNLIPQTPDLKEIQTNISTYGFPVLDALKVFKTMGFATYGEGDISVQNMTLVFEDLS